MPRARKGAARRRAKNRILKEARGNFGGRRRLIRTVKETLVRAAAYATRDRQARKRDFRRLWIQRINAGAKLHGTSYSQLIAGLIAAEVKLDRKILADLAMNDPAAFEAVVNVAAEVAAK